MSMLLLYLHRTLPPHLFPPSAGRRAEATFRHNPTPPAPGSISSGGKCRASQGQAGIRLDSVAERFMLDALTSTASPTGLSGLAHDSLPPPHPVTSRLEVMCTTVIRCSWAAGSKHNQTTHAGRAREGKGQRRRSVGIKQPDRSNNSIRQTSSSTRCGGAVDRERSARVLASLASHGLIFALLILVSLWPCATCAHRYESTYLSIIMTSIAC